MKVAFKKEEEPAVWLFLEFIEEKLHDTER